MCLVLNVLKHSDNYICHLFYHSVTLHFAHRVYTYGFCIILGINRDYSLNSNHQLMVFFVMKTHYILFETGTELLHNNNNTNNNNNNNNNNNKLLDCSLDGWLVFV
jgi:hypothetical protein